MAGGDESAEGEKLVVFGVDEGEGLGDGRGGGFPASAKESSSVGPRPGNNEGRNALVPNNRPDHPSSRTRHNPLRHLLHTTRHRRAKHPLPDLSRLRRSISGTSRQDLVRLFEEVELEEFVRFVEDELRGGGEGDVGGFESEDEAEGSGDEDV